MGWCEEQNSWPLTIGTSQVITALVGEMKAAVRQAIQAVDQAMDNIESAVIQAALSPPTVRESLPGSHTPYHAGFQAS